jgi:hypothetical protein
MPVIVMVLVVPIAVMSIPVVPTTIRPIKTASGQPYQHRHRN